MNKLRLIKTIRHEDARGFFVETYNQKKYLEFGIDCKFVQDNHSLSLEKWTLRGLHFQAPPNAQAKLVRCSRGAIFDVAVDIRRGSPTYGHWEGYELTAENGHQLYLPIGFAHGFQTLSRNSEVVYKCSDYYAPETEGSILWSDPNIAINWPCIATAITSAKDAMASRLKNFDNPFVYGENS